MTNLHAVEDNLSVESAKRLFWWSFATTLILKVVLAAAMPFTSDEAFFYQWGVRPDIGYSDHPPMVGWMLWLLHKLFGNSPLALRGVTLALTSAVALLMLDLAQRLLPPAQQARAWLAAALYLVMPFSWMFVLVTTDTPLILFMVLSGWAYLRADMRLQSDKQALGWYAAAGLFLGLAFLSKYFAALLGMAYATHLLWRRWERLWMLPLIVAMTLPAVGLHLWFNYSHGWPNILFNFINRNKDEHGSFKTFAVYAFMMAYLLTPWLIWKSLRANKIRPDVSISQPALAALWLVPTFVFALLSWRREIGLHWVLGFVPWFVVWASLQISAKAWRSSFFYTLAWSAPHLLLVMAIIWAPLSWWQSTRLYEKAVFLRQTSDVAAALEHSKPAQTSIMALGYSPAAMLAYQVGHDVPVFGVGRHHARQDDLWVDFSSYDGQDIRIFTGADAPDLTRFEPYFDRVQRHDFTVNGVRYYAVDGSGFRFQPYRQSVLLEIAQRFHDVPAFLPQSGSPFCERYHFESCLPAATEKTTH